MFDLSGKVAIVTGSSKGIGEGIAHGMAAQGAKVVVSSRDIAACKPVAEAINKKHGKSAAVAISLAADIEKKNTLQALVDKTVESWGRIDALVLNAAILPLMGDQMNTSDEMWERLLLGNIRSGFQLTKMVMPHMIKQGGGSVIFIGSGAGLSPQPLVMGYSVSKAGQDMLVKNLSAHLAKHNIRVNSVAPGLTRSFSSRPVWENPEILKSALAHTAIKRIGEPEDVAAAVVYLASDSSTYVTGSCIDVGGGHTFGLPGEGEMSFSDAFPEGHTYN